MTGCCHNMFTTRAAAVTLTMLALLPTVVRNVHASNVVGVANEFHTKLALGCFSDNLVQPTYTASSSEIYYFTFDPKVDMFWDCFMENTLEFPPRRGTFRVWGNPSHGGAAVDNCVACLWSVSVWGLFLKHGSDWELKYQWPRT